jgi:para-aminobenzoate synthetase
MRSLIIDNYDSFTYNLVHCVADVVGTEPVVVRNDDARWSPDDLHRFDNVIISPGPGHPGKPADFGICAEVIRAGAIPVLGVCLGHQGICHVYGGTVGHAPEVFHGRTSPIVHDGADILAGLPSPFSAVRYHSLMVGELPADLEAIAWTPDGIVMGLRHRRLPLWGVQFHPESICTEHGHLLLANFAELTRRWHGRRGAGRLPIGGARCGQPGGRLGSPSPARAGRWRVAHRRLLIDVPAETIFEALYGDEAYSFWLDSSMRHVSYGRVSIMGDTRGPHARVVRADVWAREVRVESSLGVQVTKGSLFDWLRADLITHEIPDPGIPFDFALGWVGYLGYELKADCGGDRAHRSEHPDAFMIFSDRAVVLAHEESAVYLLCLADRDGEPEAEAWFAETTARLLALAASPGGAGEDPGPEIAVTELSLRHDRYRYLGLIAECQTEISNGESYEICLTNMASDQVKIDPWKSYQVLRKYNPAPFGAFLRLGDLSVLSCSPERLLRVSAGGLVESKPIKGTRPRSAEPREDELLRHELATSVKDRAENLMIVDLVRNDLGRCAEMGSVTVAKLFDVEQYETVYQMVSTVQARIRPELTAVDCVRAAFPAGSMTGAPKIRSMQIIDRLEAGPRGVYSGALGYFSLSGTADFSVVIRTLVASSAGVEFGIGGAIIALSDPVAEFEETAVKAGPILRLLRTSFPGRFDGRL